MPGQKRTLAVSNYVKARLDLVYFGFQQPSRNSIIHHRYSSRKMAFDLAPKCSFHFGYFSCNLPNDMIDVNIRKDRSTQISKCSSWGMEVRPFPSLRKKMCDYIEERQAIANSFSNRSHHSRPNPSPFAKQTKATPAKKRRVVAKPRKVNVRYYPPAFQQNWVGQATFPTQPKAAEATSQGSAVPTQ